VLAHPWSRHLHRPSPRTRLTLHVSLATFTLVFTVLHIVVLVLDPWAKVGVLGALLPMASGYRPVAVTLGVLALWAGLVAGLTAALAGRFAIRVWWPIHKVAAASLVLVWAHSVLAGSDVVALQGFYLATGCAVVALAVTRYSARTPADRVAELTQDLDTTAGYPADRYGARR
jgi:predicted ferric reductase